MFQPIRIQHLTGSAYIRREPEAESRCLSSVTRRHVCEGVSMEMKWYSWTCTSFQVFSERFFMVLMRAAVQILFTSCWFYLQTVDDRNIVCCSLTEIITPAGCNSVYIITKLQKFTYRTKKMSSKDVTQSVIIIIIIDSNNNYHHSIAFCCGIVGNFLQPEWTLRTWWRRVLTRRLPANEPAVWTSGFSQTLRRWTEKVKRSQTVSVTTTTPRKHCCNNHTIRALQTPLLCGWSLQELLDTFRKLHQFTSGLFTQF